MHNTKMTFYERPLRGIKNFAKDFLRRRGYQLVAIPNWAIRSDVVDASGFKLINWKRSDGTYDLEGYRREQEAGNRAKLDQVWTNEANLRFLCSWLESKRVQPEFVVCHGTRNGFEQRIFSQCFGCEVIGTEISSTAANFPMTIRADFHEERPEWEGKADIVYSNSLDHAYDPAKALRAWARSVRDGGFIVLDKASDSDPHGVSDLDPFGIDLPRLLLFIFEALQNVACIRAVLNVPKPKEGTIYHKMILVQIFRDLG